MTRTLLIACIAASVIAPAFAQQSADKVAAPYWADRPVIEALGRVELMYPPNRASFTVEFVFVDANSGKALDASAERGRAAIAAIRTAVGDKVRIASNVAVTPYYEQFRDEEGEMQDNRSPDKVRGYVAHAALTVTATDPVEASLARAAALALGPQRAGLLSFSLEASPEMMREAQRLATEDARSRAELMAAAAGARLGDLLVMQPGNAPCLGNWTSGNAPRVAARVDPPRRISPASGADNLLLPGESEPLNVPANVCLIYTLAK